tara:strand:+ start:1650 stop:3455 length:1806 start_codon:yes stop_codon:yes gene_type:complete
MAAPKFDTTQQQSNEPGLSYITPQSMPAKYSSLIGAAALTDVLVKKGMELNKRNILDESNELGISLSDEYELSSKTGQANLLSHKTELEGQLSLDPDNDEIKAELSVVVDKYNNARSQETFRSLSEWRYRFLKETQELAEAHPQYADEISARVSKTLGNRGTIDLMKDDAALEKIASNDWSKQLNTVRKYLNEDLGISTIGWDDDQLVARYQHEMHFNQIRLTIKQIAGDEDMHTDMKERLLRKNINLLGGPHKAGYQLVAGVTSRLNVLVNRVNEGLPQKEAAITRRAIFREARTELGKIASAMGKDDEFKAVYTSTMETLKTLETDIEGDLSGERVKTALTNMSQIVSLKQYINYMERGGQSEQMVNLQNKQILNLKYMLENIDVPFSEAQHSDMVNGIMIMGKVTNQLDPDSSSMLGFKQNPKVAFNQMDLMAPTFKAMIDLEEDIKTSTLSYSYFNNMFGVVNAQTNTNIKFDVAKDLLNRIVKMNNDDPEKQSILTYMLKPGSSSWGENLKETNRFFKDAINKKASDDGVTKIMIGVDKDGKFVQNSYIARQFADELNTAFYLQMKLEGKDPTEEEADAFYDAFLTGINKDKPNVN